VSNELVASGRESCHASRISQGNFQFFYSARSRLGVESAVAALVQRSQHGLAPRRGDWGAINARKTARGMNGGCFFVEAQ